MCKYCDLKKNEYKNLLNDAPEIVLHRKNRYYYIFTVDERYSEKKYKIHYCPFCGRKLEDEE